MLQTNYLHEKLEQMAEKGWTELQLPTEFCMKILNAAEFRFQNNQFKLAGVTSEQPNSPTATIRNDLTSWLDVEQLTEQEKEIYLFIEWIQTEISQYFRFSLTHFESHFAIYKPGHYYQRHSDQTKTNNHRFFSFVIYLNHNWSEEFGGKFIGYLNEQENFEILPTFGKMVLFKSNIEHEVQPSTKDRWSLTGWLRK